MMTTCPPNYPVRWIQRLQKSPQTLLTHFVFSTQRCSRWSVSHYFPHLSRGFLILNPPRPFLLRLAYLHFHQNLPWPYPHRPHLKCIVLVSDQSNTNIKGLFRKGFFLSSTSNDILYFRFKHSLFSEVLALSHGKSKIISVFTDFTPQHPLRCFHKVKPICGICGLMYCAQPSKSNNHRRHKATNHIFWPFSWFRNVLTSAILRADSLPFLRTDGSNVRLNGRRMEPLLKPPSQAMPWLRPRNRFENIKI